MFILEKTMPNGALGKYHKAIRFEVHQDATYATVNSYHSEEMNLISWQDTYVIPIILKIENLHDVEFILTSPAAPFEGGVIVPDETATLDNKKALLKAQVKLKRNNVEWAGVASPSGTVDSDPESQRKISGAVTMALIAGDAFSMPWRMKDNTVVTLNKTAMVTLGVVVGQHVAACQEKKNEIDAAIDAATTEEEIAAIDIEAGWPS